MSRHPMVAMARPRSTSLLVRRIEVMGVTLKGYGDVKPVREPIEVVEQADDGGDLDDLLGGEVALEHGEALVADDPAAPRHVIRVLERRPPGRLHGAKVVARHRVENLLRDLQ